MKQLLLMLIFISSVLSGCNLDTRPINRYQIVETKDGLVVRLDTETGLVALITKSGVEQLKDIGPIDVPPDVQAVIDKYTTKPNDQASSPRKTINNKNTSPGGSANDVFHPPPPGVTVDR